MDPQALPFTTIEAAPRRTGRNHAGEAARLCYAAAHVVLHDRYAEVEHTEDKPGAPSEIVPYIDWEATLGFRRHLADHGFGIAEAMDTAQRFELGWPAAQRLIEETGQLAPPAGFVAGASTDQLETVRSTDDLIEGVCEQIAFIRSHGGIPVILPMPFLSINNCDESVYVETYGSIVDRCDGPLFIHWLGEMFLPALRGYFPGESFLAIMRSHPEKIRGAKISLLDAQREIELRGELLRNDQILLTGDDFHFAGLIAGSDEAGIAPIDRWTTIGAAGVALGAFSHALLGILDGIAAPARTALDALGRGDAARYFEIMTPLERLSRIIFEKPTRHYKAGLAFLAWLNGLQDNFMLVNHAERERSKEHLWRVASQAAASGALTDPDLAKDRLQTWVRARPSGA